MPASDIVRPVARRSLLRAGATTAVLATAGCNNFLPSSGPRIDGIMRPATARGGDPGSPEAPAMRYAMLTLDSAVAAGVEGDRPASLFSAALQGRAAAEIRFGIGDIL